MSSLALVHGSSSSHSRYVRATLRLGRAFAERAQPTRLAQRRRLGLGRQPGGAHARDPLVVLVVAARVAELGADLLRLRAQDLAAGLGALRLGLAGGRRGGRSSSPSTASQARVHVELDEERAPGLAPERQLVGDAVGQRRRIVDALRRSSSCSSLHSAWTRAASRPVASLSPPVSAAGEAMAFSNGSVAATRPSATRSSARTVTR